MIKEKVVSLKTKEWKIEDIETVLFDKDGTLIDLHYFWGKMTELRVEELIKVFGLNRNLFNELCLLLGYDVENTKMVENGITALYSRPVIVNILKKDLINYGIYTTESSLEEIFDRVSEQFYENIQCYTKPIKEAVDFIVGLRVKGVKIGIVTSDSLKSTNLTIRYFDWENLFDCIVGRESSSETKESGTLTKIALKQLEADCKKTLMIGDAPMDYLAAVNADVKNVILVATGQISKQDLFKTTSFVVNSLNEIEIV